MNFLKPKVAIIIPIYNVEKYVSECLDSINSQTYQNIKVVVINDGSKDTSLEIAKEYLQDSKFILIDQKNQGLSGAINSGLNEIEDCNYVYFLDSDDFIKPTTIEDLVNVAMNEGADVIQSGFIKVNENSTVLDFYSPEEISVTGIDALDLFFNRRVVIVNYWGKLFKTDFFREHRIRFIDGLLYEDHPILVEVLLKAKKFVSIGECYYSYRIREGSIMNSIDLKSVKDSQFAYNEIGNILKRMGVFSRFQKTYEEKFSSVLVNLAVKASIYGSSKNVIMSFRKAILNLGQLKGKDKLNCSLLFHPGLLKFFYRNSFFVKMKYSLKKIIHEVMKLRILR